jgi:hypothetical protein
VSYKDITRLSFILKQDDGRTKKEEQDGNMRTEERMKIGLQWV